nr:hypothetical protein [Tanacetum cinerariifolium]
MGWDKAEALLAGVGGQGLGPLGVGGVFGRPARVVHVLRNVGHLAHPNLVEVGVHDVATLYALYEYTQVKASIREVVGYPVAVLG